MTPAPSGQGSNPPDQALLEQFVDNQRRELEIRAQELEVQKARDSNHLEWSKESIAAQERDRSHERECARKRMRDRYWLIAILTAMVILLVVLAMLWGKDQLASDIVKMLAFLIAGAIGGYGIGRSQGSKATSSVEGPSDDES